MAQACDLTSLFNEEAFSDLTIRLSDREIKCHKVVLCAASDYFKALCGPASKFSEKDLTTIELYEDNPDALEAALRYLYNTPYHDIQTHLGYGLSQRITVQMALVVAARKYLIPKLETEALKGLHTAIGTLEYICRQSGGATLLFELIKLLLDHKDHNPKFEDKVVRLLQSHMSEVPKLQEFRSWLDSEEGTVGLELAKAAMESGTRVEEEGKWSGIKLQGAQMARCMTCFNFWEVTNILSATKRCPDCSNCLVVPWDDYEL